MPPSSPAAAARADLVSGIQVVVNSAVVTYGQIKEALTPILGPLQNRFPDPGDQDKLMAEVNKVKDQQVENLVERQLILHEFDTGGYATNVVEAFVNDHIRDDIKRRFYGDRARLIRTLQAEGMTYEMYRRQERENLIISIMVNQNTSQKKILISPVKIGNYYAAHTNDFKLEDQVNLSMIVIPQPSDAPAGQARAIAQEIVTKLDAGVPFEEMAKVYSSGSQRATGGDRGWVSRSYFRPELAQVAFSLKPGKRSDVIELPDACYILLVKESRPAHVRPLQEVRNDIEQTLQSDESLRLRTRWIERLRRKSFVQYY